MQSILAPSLLAGDHARLADSVARVENFGVKWLHIDIMDGHFAPNLTFGPGTVAALRQTSKLFFDVHLMLDEPHRYIEAFAKAGADGISIHVESDCDHVETLARIRALGCKNGITINPATPVESVESLLSSVDMVLVMTVQPGFGGQAFRRDMLPKIARLAEWRLDRGLDFRIEVDGGVDLSTAKECRSAGADTFVAGTAFFRAADPASFAAIFAGMK